MVRNREGCSLLISGNIFFYNKRPLTLKQIVIDEKRAGLLLKNNFFVRSEAFSAVCMQINLHGATNKKTIIL